jgi:hypothetical protein
VVTLVRPTLTAHLLDLVERRTPAQRDWLRGVAAADPRALEVAFIDSTRRVGAAALSLDADEHAVLRGVGVDWPLDAWAVDDVVRAAWLILASGSAGGDALVDRRWRTGDTRQRTALLRALPVVPEPTRWLRLAIGARHGAVRAVFEALACDNPYPATYFHDVHFEDMVLAALDAGLPLGRIVGLGRRVTTRLSTTAMRFAAALRASGRRPPADLCRLTEERGSAA